jgi:hypothetical protein
MAIKLIERNAHVCFKIITRTTITWQASGSESKKQYGNQLFHFLPLTQQMDAIHFSGLDEAKFGVSFVIHHPYPLCSHSLLTIPKVTVAGMKSVCG